LETTKPGTWPGAALFCHADRWVAAATVRRERIKISDDTFRGSVADQLRRLVDLIAAAKADDRLNPLAWRRLSN